MKPKEQVLCDYSIFMSKFIKVERHCYFTVFSRMKEHISMMWLHQGNRGILPSTWFTRSQQGENEIDEETAVDLLEPSRCTTRLSAGSGAGLSGFKSQFWFSLAVRAWTKSLPSASRFSHLQKRKMGPTTWAVEKLKVNTHRKPLGCSSMKSVL